MNDTSKLLPDEVVERLSVVSHSVDVPVRWIRIIAAELINRRKTESVQLWTKPSERLPEVGDLVVVKGKNGVYDVDKYVIEVEDLFIDEVECWMKLPEPKV